ncbi:hypothetical protein M9458_057214 [Cirrhinus mrigala]|uniref:Uncharacterized protein n=1 Tax=Cirrhinus mrigala TaxID=683832 RepID=A0ABD0MF27_CIRMR
MLWAEDFLFNIQQAERLLEHYVEEFLSVVHLVSWSDATINTCFQIGLNDDKLFNLITPEDCRKPVAEFINHVLALCHSEFFVDVEDSHLPPICKHAAAPAHHQPASSTCGSNEPTPSGPPSLTPVLHHSSHILSPEPAASALTPAAPAASSRTPATPLRSGSATNGNMASQIFIKDYVDSYGLLSPPSPLVPSSSPKPPLIPSIPPEPVLPPEPELRPARPPEAELPPARPPEPAPPPVPPERPPEPAPPERPPEPAPPERPPVSAFPKPGLPVLSWAGKALSSPKKILGGGYSTDQPWLPGRYTRPWLPDLPDPPWLPGRYTRPWLPELPDRHGHMDYVLGHGSPHSPILHGFIDSVLRYGSASSLIRPGGVPPIPPVSAPHEPPGRPPSLPSVFVTARVAPWGGGGFSLCCPYFVFLVGLSPTPSINLYTIPKISIADDDPKDNPTQKMNRQSQEEVAGRPSLCGNITCWREE